MYKYEIWHEGNCIIDRTGVDDAEYEFEDDAYDDAEYEVIERIQGWKDDGCWDGETLDDFDIRVKEM